jgi:hypothetical protein
VIKFYRHDRVIWKKVLDEGTRELVDVGIDMMEERIKKDASLGKALIP